MLKKIVYASLIVFISGTAVAQTPAENYIESYKKVAVTTMNQHGIPASIILGIAIHESASGTSRIAKYLNNHFGLKGKSGPKPIKSAYKGYDNVNDCYVDFVSFLKNQFTGLFTRYASDDYRGWAMGIQRGGYAHSRTWASQVTAIIRKYKLNELDTPSSSILQSNVSAPATSEEINTYNVKRGDTLIRIAERFRTTVKEIKNKNGLTSSMLNIGQSLHL
ncbi:glucosaminidase domain and LysM peptidoglycan-binding domain-containing protein [Arcticibacter eurypsychrophilus]|uniref:glucosaminidase domain and LysM peptidoglycan-binding domain-containing protein n=1 Tax=Arcticibacter eurypsychrophilus TaxID=1434752 RepID=UPI00084DF644|nr:glucosaminidase domain-containing protein [Arcticibacter eurypsychrophilus]